ncbi:MAG: tetratricopeptide repeat protein [Candidatus Gastranaerophilaceae bacterium]
MKNSMESRAAIYYKNKKYLQAAECYSELIKNSIVGADVYLALAACYYNLEEFEKAVITLNELILLDGAKGFYVDYANAWKAMALMMLKKYDESYKTWKKLETADEDLRDENYYFCGASCCNELGLYEEALEYINKSIFIKKQDSYNLILKGKILANMGKLKEAGKVFEKVCLITSPD